MYTEGLYKKKKVESIHFSSNNKKVSDFQFLKFKL